MKAICPGDAAWARVPGGWLVLYLWAYPKAGCAGAHWMRKERKMLKIKNKKDILTVLVFLLPAV
ncbi:hypothetical protein, partial [Faecalicatena contorta]|uniref:hypothetical protein n=1 Tax=Faecalicatena contorta TaxID=39482 RepID=UPI0032170ECB